MKRTLTLSIMIIFSLLTYAQNIGSLTQQAGLVQQIMQSTGVDQNQALGGAGALFGMAKESMNADDFGKVSEAVPDMEKMLDAVPEMGAKTSTFSAAATNLVGMPKVVAAFDKLGISQDKVALFTPVIVKHVEEKGGKLLGDKLLKAFNK